jgi:hypothetical protein
MKQIAGYVSLQYNAQDLKTFIACEIIYSARPNQPKKRGR